MKDYLGDGVYAEWDDYSTLILTTENGISVENQIYLEPEVFAALERFMKRIKEAA
jgi:hypothetical protein